MAPRRRARSGMSPIMADMMMLVVTVASFSAVFATANTIIELQRETNFNAVKERLLIENVEFQANATTATNTNVTVYVRNIGRVEIKIVAAKIDGVSYPIAKAVADVRPDQMLKELTLKGGETGFLVIHYAKGWQPGREVRIQLVSERGSAFEVPATP